MDRERQQQIGENGDRTRELCPAITSDSFAGTGLGTQYEFEAHYLHLSPFYSVSGVGVVYLLFLTMYGIVERQEDALSNVSDQWRLVSSLPHGISFVVHILIVFIVIKGRPNSLFKYNDVYSALTVTNYYINTVYFGIVRSARRSILQVDLAPTIKSKIDFSGIIPVRVCNDSDPVKTFREWPFPGQAVGCNELMYSCTYIAALFVIQKLPPVLKMGWTYTAMVAVGNTASTLVAVLSVGSASWMLVTLCGLQLVTALGTVFICKVREELARVEFECLKQVRSSAKQNMLFLNTLVPPNVLRKLGTRHGDAFLCTEIPHCVIMFCSLVPTCGDHIEMSEDYFRFLDESFSNLDRAVEHNHMFKYQHVGEWYIVACPRASSPFDDEEQRRPYPPQHVSNMLTLADELVGMACTFSFRGRVSFALKVGISFGPAAGAVIGTLRSFYCLYGDTVNMAARMCKHAEPGTVRCTHAFADLLGALAAELRGVDVTCRSRGLTEVKGKGVVETFEVRAVKAVRDASPPVAVERAKGARQQRKSWTLLLGPHVAKLFDSAIPRARKDGQAAAETEVNTELDSHVSERFRMGRWLTFVDPSIEKLFVTSQAYAHRHGIVCFYLIHLTAIAFQFHCIAFPDYDYDFAALGAPDIERGHRATRLLLGTHLAASTLLVCAFFSASCLCPQIQSGLFAWAHVLVLVLQVTWIGVSIAATHLHGTVGWTIIFSAVTCMGLEGLCISLFSITSFPAQAARIWMSTLICFATMFAISGTGGVNQSLRTARPGTLMLEVVTIVVGVMLFLVVSWRVHHGERTRFRSTLILRDELVRLRKILLDLIPEQIAQRFIDSDQARAPPSRASTDSAASTCSSIHNMTICELCPAVVLQMDICGFTMMSSCMPALDLARLIHRIFSRLDSAVRELRLFKMDTIGDAYIVAGFLPAKSLECDSSDASGLTIDQADVGEERAVNFFVADKENDPSFRERVVCRRVMDLAKVALKELAAVRQETGLEVKVRVGVAVGEVVVGALGRMQPRIHIRGPGMNAAERMESTGRPDAVHVSDTVFSLLYGNQGTGEGGTASVVNPSAVGIEISPHMDPVWLELAHEHARADRPKVSLGPAAASPISEISAPCKQPAWLREGWAVNDVRVHAEPDPTSQTVYCDPSSPMYRRRRVSSSSLVFSKSLVSLFAATPCDSTGAQLRTSLLADEKPPAAASDEASSPSVCGVGHAGQVRPWRSYLLVPVLPDLAI